MASSSTWYKSNTTAVKTFEPPYDGETTNPLLVLGDVKVRVDDESFLVQVLTSRLKNRLRVAAESIRPVDDVSGVTRSIH